MREMNVIVVGDAMIDRYYEGSVTRLSPEAPCPIVDVNGFMEVPGGAANVALNVASLGVPCDFVTVLGGAEDDEGAEGLRTWMNQERNVRLHSYHFKGFRTPIKSRVCSAGGQQLVRFDQQDARPFTDAGAANAIYNRVEALMRKARHSGKPSILVLSDYGKGIFNDDDVLQGLLKVAQIMRIPVLVDPASSHLKRYLPATLIKPNLVRAQLASGRATAEDCAEQLLHEFYPSVQGILVTAGMEGMRLAVPSEGAVRVETIPAYPPQQFCNPVGAGDVVTAVLAINLACRGRDYAEIRHSFRHAAKLASIGAGAVVRHAGTAVLQLWDYEAALAEYCVEPPNKLASLEAAMMVVEDAKQSGDRVVFTNGCFDQLHPGHLHLLQEARRMGDVLIVAVNNDETVTKLKGPGRPLVPCKQRVRMLQALSCVDLVLVFDEDTPEKLIRMLKPHLLVKGDEYFTEDVASIPGAEFVIQNGLGVVFVKMLEGYSTTTAITKAGDSFNAG